jgi:hypothetical protein
MPSRTSSFWILPCDVLTSSETRSFVDRCMALSSAVLLFHDYALTIGMEADRYWSSKITWPAALFFITRYLALFAQAPLVLQAFWHAPVQVRNSVIGM